MSVRAAHGGVRADEAIAAVAGLPCDSETVDPLRLRMLQKLFGEARQVAEDRLAVAVRERHLGLVTELVVV